MVPVVKELIAALGETAVVYGKALHGRPVSHWDASPSQGLALVFAKTTEDVGQVLRICYRHNQPVVTQGGLTGCARGADAGSREVILSLEKMGVIEAVDPIGGTATVQAGVPLQVVQESLAEQDLLFPLDLGARGTCTIGGNVATNAGGINVLRYGMMRNLVLGLEAVLADGTVLSNMNSMLKNNAGYDLKQMFIGSEGTLGVITRAVLKVFPKPLSRCTALVAITSFQHVTDLLQALRRDLAGTLSAFEVMWGNYYTKVTEPGWHRAPISRDFPFYVVLEAEGAEPVKDDKRFNQVLEQVFNAGIVADAVISKSDAQRCAIWDIRENFEAVLQTKPVYLYDISLPVKDMPAYVEQVQVGLRQRWPKSECYLLGHIADGNLHLFIKTGQEGDLHRDVDLEVYGPLRNYGGSVSAEHGIGKEKKAWLGYTRSESEIELMRVLKQTLDPKGILNPGRVFDMPPQGQGIP